MNTGDTVNVNICLINGRSISFTTRRGTLVSLRTLFGTVRLKNGRMVTAAFKDITPLGGRTARAKAVMGEEGK